MSTMQDAAAWTAIAIQVANEKHLTGAEKELLDYNAEQAQIAREFNANEARLAREFNANEALLNRQFQSAEAALARQWQEDFYNNYESPAARMRQYQDAGLNPALMYQSAPGGNIPSASSPSGSAASGSAASGPAASGSAMNRQSALAQMFLQLAQLDAHIENVNADTAQKLASAQGQQIANDYSQKSNPLNLEKLRNDIKLAEQNLKESDWRIELHKSNLNLNDANCRKIIEETNKVVVETATERLKQDNISITNEKLAAEIVLVQMEKSLKAAQTYTENLRGESISLQNWEQGWKNEYRDEVGAGADTSLPAQLSTFIGSFAVKTSNSVKSIVDFIRNYINSK